jgi:hypothetical protein
MIVESHLTVDGQVLVVDLTWIVTVLPAWTRPSVIFRQATMTTPVAETRRWTVTGSVDGWGGGSAGAGGAKPQDLVG